MNLSEIKNELLKSGAINECDIEIIESEAKCRYELVNPILIENWEQLKECKSETHSLEIDLFYGNGWIRSKEDGEHDYYLSTHTFYESQYKGSTKLLQECGSNVELASWG